MYRRNIQYNNIDCREYLYTIIFRQYILVCQYISGIDFVVGYKYTILQFPSSATAFFYLSSPALGDLLNYKDDHLEIVI
jgi:hypothetical protein